MNVSSIIVKTNVEHMEEVAQSINEINLCEVHFSDSKGNIAITIEGTHIDAQMQTLKRIQDMPHVISSNLVYSYCEDEIKPAIDRINELHSAVHG